MTKARDGCVVPSGPLAGILSVFVDEWKRSREVESGRFSRSRETQTTRNAVSALAPIEWLAAETGIPQGTIANIVHREKATGALRPKNGTTELRIADALMMAIGRPEVFVDGSPPTLPVLPNPLASREARAECCGGSETLLGA